jgi:hypothetical protein
MQADVKSNGTESHGDADAMMLASKLKKAANAAAKPKPQKRATANVSVFLDSTTAQALGPVAEAAKPKKKHRNESKA